MWVNVMNKGKRRSIKTKLIMANLTIITVVLLVLALFVYQYFSEILLDSAIRDSQKRLEEISLQMDAMEYQLSYIADYIITDTSVAEYAHVNQSKNIKEINDDIYDMKKVLTRFVVLNEYLSGVYLLRDDHISFTNNVNFDRDYVDRYVAKLLNDLERDKLGNRRFSDIHEVYANNVEKKMDVITYIVKYNNITYSNEENYLLLDVEYETITNIMEQGRPEFDNILLLNKENKLYYGNQLADEGVFSQLIQSAHSKIIEENDYIYIFHMNEESNWKYIVTIPKSKLFNTIMPVIIAILMTILISYVIIIGTTVPILSGIVNPIKQLTHGMKQVAKGDYKVNLQVNSGDEVEALAEGFNMMTSRIEQSIEESVQQERIKRKLQLDLLMNQINPHFIYNTLNAVIYMAHAKETKAVEEITYSLINVLRDSVKLGKESIQDSLFVELEIIKNYMRIQKYRYPDMFEFHINCEEDLLKMNIPKMVIQPLVENALFHGVCLSDQKCKIEVSISKVMSEETEKIKIQITDDGVGMNEEILNRCFQKRETDVKTNQTRGIGLSNIKERLEFLFGKNQSIHIKSQLGQGTRIQIIIPMNNES